ncbi:MAG: phosphatidate cytidylyltransferase [Bacillota bacterium]|nr:phosphatidate cytidylyltransferase [Bacillota bacterium]
MSEFVKRNISTFVAFFILATVFYMGEIAMHSLVTLTGILMIFELNRALEIQKSIVGYLSVILIGISVHFDIKMEPFTAAVCTLNVLLFVFSSSNIKKFAVASLSIVYIAIPIYFALKILKLYGTSYFLLSLLIPMMTDIFAYITGRLIGRTKLVPKISPKKTVEGLIGGLMISTLISGTYMIYVLHLPMHILYCFIPIVILLSLVSQFGDFAASKIKREIGIKDYGDIIPGHGGLLDRFDSYLLVFPTFFVFLSYVSIP